MTIYRLRDFAGVFALCALFAFASFGGSSLPRFALPPAWFSLARTIAQSGPLDWRGKAPAGLADAALPNEIDDPDVELAALPRERSATDRATSASIVPGPIPAAPPLAPPPAPERPAAVVAPPTLSSRAAQLFHAGDSAGLLALAGAASDPVQRLGLEWASLRVDPHPSDLALSSFAAAHPGWPGAGWIESMEEADLAIHPPAAKVLEARFIADPPSTPVGKLAQARNARALGREAEAERIIRALWRNGNFDLWTEGAILKDFAGVLSKADHKYRADRLAYAESFAPALRAAALAGADEVALIQARALASHGAPPANLAIAAPASLQGDPGYLFARLQDARRAERTLDAVELLEQAPANAAALIDPDKWWSERRMVARQLLDQQYFWLAYFVCDTAVAPRDPALKVDAAFHAGWIALRFLDDAPKAARHFADAAAAAATPLSIARAAYWQGRAAEALGQADAAKAFYTRAAAQPIAYYGQLAARRLGVDQPALRPAPAAATGEARADAVRVAEFLYGSGLDRLANSLAFEAARRWSDGAQLAAMADVLARLGDPVAEVEFGKIATGRGFAFDATAFPLRGVPSFVPLAHSADRANIYAVVRQESEFLWRAASGAGAKGLMQILPSTAADTARRAGIAFDFARLIADPAFNTQLGAAFLGRLIEDEGGSEEVAFAAYNAGAGRVAQWLAQYGDPRNGTADPVDWVERIPFDETRDYVERVSENLSVYRARFANAPPPPPPSLRMARE